MLTLAVSASLAVLLDADPCTANGSIRSVRIEADNWPGAVGEIRDRFPQLAERVFTDAGLVRQGFLVAVNDVVAVGNDVPEVRPGDEIFLLVQLAGG